MKRKIIFFILTLLLMLVASIFTISANANSLIITVHVPEGIIMAADSRQSLTIYEEIRTVSTDTITKIFLLESQQVGISTCGQSFFHNMPIANHIKLFIEKELTSNDDVVTIPKKLLEYFRKSFGNIDVRFCVAGYKKENKVSVPHVYSFNIKENIIERVNVNFDNTISYGITWGGELDILESIIKSVIIEDEKGNKKIIREVAPIIWESMTLQDAIDFSIYAIRTTIDTMRFQARPKTVGGPIDVLLLTPGEVKWIQSKELHGEVNNR